MPEFIWTPAPESDELPTQARVRCNYFGHCSNRASSDDGLVPLVETERCMLCNSSYCTLHHHSRPTGRASQYCGDHGDYHATCVDVSYCDSCHHQHCDVPECILCGEYHCECAEDDTYDEGYGNSYNGDYRNVSVSFPDSPIVPNATGNRHVGFEIEAESGGSFYLPREFGITRDGSLDNGIEVLTPPRKGESLVDALHTAMNAMKDADYQIHETCGLHTHIDVRDRAHDMRFLARLFTLGFTFEQLLYNLQESNRHHNGYSIPIRNEYGFNAGRANVAKDFEFVYEKVSKKARWSRMRLREGRRDKYGGQRYIGFNFHSVFHRGSLEVRIHEGTLDADRAISWSEVLQKIVTRAEKRLSYKSLLGFMELKDRKEIISKAEELLSLDQKDVDFIDSVHRTDYMVDIPWHIEHAMLDSEESQW